MLGELGKEQKFEVIFYILCVSISETFSKYNNFGQDSLISNRAGDLCGS